MVCGSEWLLKNHLLNFLRSTQRWDHLPFTPAGLWLVWNFILQKLVILTAFLPGLLRAFADIASFDPYHNPEK